MIFFFKTIFFNLRPNFIVLHERPGVQLWTEAKFSRFAGSWRLSPFRSRQFTSNRQPISSQCTLLRQMYQLTFFFSFVSAPVTRQGCVQVSRFPRLHRPGTVDLQPQADAGEPAQTHSLRAEHFTANKHSCRPAQTNTIGSFWEEIFIQLTLIRREKQSTYPIWRRKFTT